MKHFFKATVASLVMLAGLALPAAASVITDTRLYYGATLNLTGGDLGTETKQMMAGQIVITTDVSGPLGVWCIDLFHNITIGNSAPDYNFTESNFTTDGNGGALTEAEIDKVEAVAAFGNAILRDDSNSTHVIGAISPVLDVIYDQDMLSVSAADVAAAKANLYAFGAAIQAMIWNIEYGVTVSDATRVLSTGAQVVNLTSFNTAYAIVNNNWQYFTNVGGYQLNPSTVVDGVRAQNLLVSDVPEPGSLSLFGLGLLGLLWGSKSIRKNAG